MTDYTFEIKDFPAVRVACLRTRAPYARTGDQLAVLYRAVKSGAAGAPFNLYYDGEYAESADMETCIPLKDGAAPEGAAVRTLPAFRGLCTRHLGPFDTLNLAYKALLDYSVENSLTLGLPARETYLKGPGMIFQGDPETYEAEIVIPLK